MGINIFIEAVSHFELCRFNWHIIYDDICDRRHVVYVQDIRNWNHLGQWSHSCSSHQLLLNHGGIMLSSSSSPSPLSLSLLNIIIHHLHQCYHHNYHNHTSLPSSLFKAIFMSNKSTNNTQYCRWLISIRRRDVISVSIANSQRFLQTSSRWFLARRPTRETTSWGTLASHALIPHLICK